MKDQRKGKIGKQRLPQVLAMIDEGYTAAQMADYLDVNPETVRKFARKRGLVIRRMDMSGENHPCWAGGMTLDRSGYLMRRVPVDGEFGYLIRALQKRGKAGTDSQGYAPEHRIVMHTKLGRRLQAGEVVDHIDGNISNNDPSNLRLFASNADHLRATLIGRVPNWTPEGKARMTGRPPKNRATTPEPVASVGPSKIDDQA